MSIIVAEKYVVRVGKTMEFTALLGEFLKFKKSHPQLFKGVKSWKLYKQDFGQPAGMYVEMWEYENLAKLEEINNRIFSDESMKKINAAFHKLVEPATFSASIWSEVAGNTGKN
jgi:hypothetical protein